MRDGKKLNTDFFALVNERNFSQNIILKNDDFIFINNNFDNRINIMGEVESPKVITFQDGMTVLDAVLMAEGLTDIARPRETRVYRRNKEGSKNETTKILVELDKVIFDGDLSKNLILQPGDIIHVPRSFF